MFAVLDRRVGKRTLYKLKNEIDKIVPIDVIQGSYILPFYNYRDIIY